LLRGKAYTRVLGRNVGPSRMKIWGGACLGKYRARH